MSKKLVLEQLQAIENAKRDNREKVALIAREDLDFFSELVAFVFNVDDKLSIRAAWVVEWVCTHGHLDMILPHLDIFTKNIKNLHYDSAIRPCAKICEYLAKAYMHKNHNNVKDFLKPKHIDAIVETGFDWLITPQKIAVRAYTMETLFQFGKTRDWIHPELEHLIRTKIMHESKGCKARGNHILSAISKHKA